MEGFKDDMYSQYPDAKDNEKFNNAIKAFNSDNKIKDAVKKKINLNGNIAKSIKNAYPTADKFIEFINSISTELTTKEQEREEYKQLKQGTVSAGETDYWMIPCHTFKELHEAAFKYTGNLPRLSKEEISKKYGIDTPKPATFYSTNQTPAKFLKYMKNQDKFFMAPSWCIAGSEKGRDYFDRYKLETSKDEKPRCYIFISKKYPNVRFCLTFEKEDKVVVKDIFYKEEKIKVISDAYTLDEVRDPWQIGGSDIRKTGLKMMKLAFGPKINEVIKDIRSPETKMIPFSELKDGNRIFCKKSSNISSINSSFNNLINGYEMFTASGFEKVNCKFPALKDGDRLFYFCRSLIEFTGNLPKLTNAENMFSSCDNLKKFECKDLSELVDAAYMFNKCWLLEKFECDLPKLRNASNMFYYCKSLETFDRNLSSLESSFSMFSHSGIKIFKSNLPELTSARNMFYACENLERFDTPLPKLKYGINMFCYCEKLKSFNSELPNLEYGESMFDECDLIEFEIDMPKLIIGHNMFCKNKNLKSVNCKLSSLKNADSMFLKCENLTSFRGDLSSLSCGNNMFKDCKNLRRFEGDLSSLEYGLYMFSGCKLDTESVKNIAKTISNGHGHSITIGIDEMDEEKKKYIEIIKRKGWDVSLK